MTITNGTVLGPYEIVEPLGAGGMGEVYRARDTRLERSVAIKVLPQGIASGNMRARFDREAKAISALTHANICALYDVGHQDGIDYLVMEYLEGETLADKLARGPLPLSQVLRYGAEIAQALHHAHRRGITHRDLKPGNVMITAGGVKLLDFGLAKLAERPQGISGESQTLTRKDPLTAEGTIVGTLPYMSPEHVEGKIVDHRGDIFSLGVMLYEMATGRRPFTGNSQAALIASILSSDPPPQASIPPVLDRVIRTALEKDPDERWQTAQDLARQLRWISEPSAQIAAASRGKRRWPFVAVALLIAIAAGALGWLAGRRQRAAVADTAPMRLTITLPRDVMLLSAGETNPFAISPDGTKIALIAWSGDDTALFVRRLDATDVRKIDGTEGATSPFWSSDSAWIAYSARGKLWKTPPAGGTRQAIGDAGIAGVVGSWQGDTILFTDRPGGRKVVYRVSASGGEPVAVTKLNAAERESQHGYPYLVEDGRHFLYVSSVHDSIERRLHLASLDSPASTKVLTNVSAARVSGNRLLYVRDGKLLSQSFQSLKVGGEPRVVAEDVLFFLPTSGAAFDVSRNGVLVYRTDTSSGRLTLIDRRGAETRVLDDQGLIHSLDVSPDGKKAAIAVRTRATGLTDIWIYDLTRGLRDRFTSIAGMEIEPVWSPDGRAIVYSVGVGTPPRLVHHSLSASAPRALAAPGNFQIARSFSPDGKHVYYSSYVAAPVAIQSDLHRAALDGSSHAEVLKTEFDEFHPAVSPDGRWLAFAFDATGSNEVYVQSLATGERVRISNRGGHSPRWRADSGELFYLATDRRAILSAVPGALGRWDAVTLAELLRRRERIQAYDLLPDGQSFVISEITSGPGDDYIHVATGW